MQYRHCHLTDKYIHYSKTFILAAQKNAELGGF